MTDVAVVKRASCRARDGSFLSEDCEGRRGPVFLAQRTKTALAVNSPYHQRTHITCLWCPPSTATRAWATYRYKTWQGCGLEAIFEGNMPGNETAADIARCENPKMYQRVLFSLFGLLFFVYPTTSPCFDNSQNVHKPRGWVISTPRFHSTVVTKIVTGSPWLHLARAAVSTTINVDSVGRRLRGTYGVSKAREVN